MAHIYMSFDFGTDEEKAQLARHKLEMWKQAFRLDKKMLYKFERTAADGAAGGDGQEAGPKSGAAKSAQKKEAAKAGKSGKAGKSTEQAEAQKTTASGNVKLHLRLAMPAHERMTEERFLKKFPAEEPFQSASPVLVRQGQPGFAEADAVFEALE